MFTTFNELTGQAFQADISELNTLLLKQPGLFKPAADASSPLVYVMDYTRQKYLYLDPAASELFCFNENIPDNGHIYFKDHWHENDLKIFNKKIFPEVTDFLKKESISDYQNFSFSYNYRVKAKDGTYNTLLQRSTFFAVSEDGDSMAAVGFLIDITNYKTDSSIIHTIKKTDAGFAALARVPLFKSVHYPDKEDSVLSKREHEILESIHLGLSSKEIAEKHLVSINTINNHRKNMLHKTNTKNSTQLVHYARKKGLF